MPKPSGSILSQIHKAYTKGSIQELYGWIYKLHPMPRLLLSNRIIRHKKTHTIVYDLYHHYDQLHRIWDHHASRMHLDLSRSIMCKNKFDKFAWNIDYKYALFSLSKSNKKEDTHIIFITTELFIYASYLRSIACSQI